MTEQPLIAVLDYGIGNLRSAQKALQRCGADARLTVDHGLIADADAVVLPGVGAFGDCARGIEARGLWEPLAQWLAADRPFLGICVGYQLLFDESEETPGVCGFGFFPGRVKKFTAPGLKIPQIGWNALDLTAHPLWRGLPAHPHVYFVHSYFPVPLDESAITARATYGETFAASAARGRVAGTQFHPEKSQAIGLGILRNFIRRTS